MLDNAHQETEAVRVIVLSWNRPIYLWTCLDSLYRYTRYPAEFVLVDNGSTDPLVGNVIDAFERRGMFLHVEKGISNSPDRLNEAIRRFTPPRSKFVVVIESDVAVFDTDPCWLSRMIALMESDDELGLLGSLVDVRDFVDPVAARKLAPGMDEHQFEGLVKAQSPERTLLDVGGPVIDPFNPPGRLLMYRAEILDKIRLGDDGLLYHEIRRIGRKSGIATTVLHRHLSLLNFYDYPDYSMHARDAFMQSASEPAPPAATSKQAYVDAINSDLLEFQPTLHALSNQLEDLATESPEHRRLADLRNVIVSGIFDRDYYLSAYPDIAAAGVDPLAHYMGTGFLEQRRPNAHFDPVFYVKQLGLDLTERINPLLHYIAVGESARLATSHTFHPSAYLRRYPQLADFVERPLYHFLRVGEPMGLTAVQAGPGDSTFDQVQEDVRKFQNSGLHDLPALMRIKRACVARLGVSRGYSEYRSLLDLPNEGSLVHCRLEKLRDYARKFAPVFVELAPAGERFSIDPPMVVGEGNPRPQTSVSRSLFVTRLDATVVRSRSALLIADKEALVEMQGEEFTRSDDRFDFDPAIFHADGRQIWRIEDSQEPAIRIEEAFSLVGCHSHAFGHWMWEYLPKYIAALSGGMPNNVPVLVDEYMPQTHFESIQLLNPGVRIVTLASFQSAFVEKLWTASSQSQWGFMELMNERFQWEYFLPVPKRFARFIEELRSRSEHIINKAVNDRRLFLARREFRHRKLVNEAQLRYFAQDFGFEILYLEDLTFDEQVRAMNSATHVIGPNGSALTQAMFCRPGTHVCLLNHPYTLELQDLTSVLGAAGINIHMLAGEFSRAHPEYPQFGDYTIDPGLFRRHLRGWLESTGAGPESVALEASRQANMLRQRLEISGWPLLEVMQLKRTVRQVCSNADDGLALYRAVLSETCMDDLGIKSMAAATGTRRMPIDSLEAWARSRAFSFKEIYPGGTPFEIDPAHVLGDPKDPLPTHGTARTIFVACLSDCMLRGRSSFIETADQILLDFQCDELARSDDAIEFDPAVFERESESWLRVIDFAAAEVPVLECAFSLLGPHAHDFGHWIWEFLPRLIVALDSDELRPMPVLIDHGMPATHREALEMLLPKGFSVIEVPAYRSVRVAKLWVASALVYVPLMEVRKERIDYANVAAHPGRFGGVIDSMTHRFDASLGRPKGGRRVYLARQHWRRRKLLNASRIEAIARSHGFEVVFPDELDFRDQVTLVREADFLVGPDGSAFYLAFFAGKSANACILSNRTIGITFVEQTILLQAAGWNVTFLIGDTRQEDPYYPDFADYEIDEFVFGDFLRSWLADPPNTPDKAEHT